MQRVFAVALGLSAIACVAAPFAVVGQRHAPRPAPPAAVTHTVPPPRVVVETAARPAEQEPEPPHEHTFRVADLAGDSRVTLVSGSIGKRVFLTALAASGLSAKECRRVLAGFSGSNKLEGLNPNRLSADDTFQYAKAKDGHVVAFELVPAGADRGDSLDFFQEHEDKPGERLAGKRVSLPIERKVLDAAIVVGDDLRASLSAAGLKDQAASLIDDALDGHTELSDIRSGARLRVILTEERIEGAFAGYAPVDAVELSPAEGGTAQARTPKPAIRVYGYAYKHTHGYYDAQGRQPYHGAWRSPVPMARISSRFDPHRMHPVLHVVMPHNGVDFAAPPGTPVYAAAAGVIRSVSSGGPCGNMVQIDHPPSALGAGAGLGTLTSAYCHLSRFGPIHTGEHVETRQLIGYVGQTGRATGPHLHFAVKRWTKSGMEVFIDPLSMKLDGVRVIPPRFRAEFDALRKTLDQKLDAIPLPPAPKGGDHERNDPQETE
jgi:murein DD-endopeptidase MepM/ murein hydrolase activator NlpD